MQTTWEWENDARVKSWETSAGQTWLPSIAQIAAVGEDTDTRHAQNGEDAWTTHHPCESKLQVAFRWRRLHREFSDNDDSDFPREQAIYK